MKLPVKNRDNLIKEKWTKARKYCIYFCRCFLCISRYNLTILSHKTHTKFKLSQKPVNDSYSNSKKTSIETLMNK